MKMKVKLRDIELNPYRPIYPQSPTYKERMAKLRQSIRQTGFWANIVARRKGDKYELAYGVHRYHALILEYGDDFSIELTIMDITDADMIRMMAAENDTIPIMEPAFINGTVRNARAFLKDHPEEEEKLRRSVTPEKSDGYEREYQLIAAFLGWPESRVEEALAAIHEIENGEISQREYEAHKTQGTAKKFRKEVKERKQQENNTEQIGSQAATDLKRPVRTIGDALKLGWADDVNQTARTILGQLKYISEMMTDEVIAKWDCLDPECREAIACGIRLLYKKYQKIRKLKI